MPTATERRRKYYVAEQSEKPRPCDSVQPGTCRRCGRPGRHPTDADCIDSLRDEIAIRDMKILALHDGTFKTA